MEVFVFTCRLNPPVVTPLIQFLYVDSAPSLLPFFQAPLGSIWSFGFTYLEQRTSTANAIVMHGTHAKLGHQCPR